MTGCKVTAYLALGSNIGDREAYLAKALKMLGETEGVKVTNVSTFLNTKPVGYTDQPDFLNAVVEIETTLEPHTLLGVCNEIEQNLKRKRIIHWGPRTIDVDILLFGDLVLEDETLTIPHPRMTERNFVMQPLSEIAPNVIHPVLGKTVWELYGKIH
jgi:2-amino-4-hydroxy-6-hydroxymethyldihydropteridine diphosphokinase/dihydroneopterin aldolase/2-amino-4-hydroxy-6-hydroxymethyldihydropteridine diphosphokinase